MVTSENLELVEGLVGWLNDDKPELAEARRVVAEAVEELWALHQLPRTVATSGTLRDAVQFMLRPTEAPVPPGDRFGEMRRSLLLKFSEIPLRWHLLKDAMGQLSVRAISVDVTPAQRVLDWLAQITQAGLFHRLRQCKRGGCGKWFTAGRTTKNFCSRDCQEEHWNEVRRTPQGREHQRKRIARWRAQQKRSKGRKSL